MNDVLIYAAAFGAGLVLGGLFFLGLWISLRHAEGRENRMGFLVVSFFVRAAAVLAAVVVVAKSGGFYGVVAFMAAFVLARIAMTYGLRRSYG